MKKKILPLLLFIFMTFVTFNSLYFSKSNNEYNKLKNLENNLINFNITISTSSTDSNHIYKTLVRYLDEYEGNIYYSDIVSDINETTYINYVYFANENLFNSIVLTSGRTLNKSENDSKLYMSTLREDNPNQIGVVSDFSGKNNFEIRTLKSNLNISTFNKTFTLQLDNIDTLNKFISDLENEEIYIQKSSEVYTGGISSIYLIFIIIGCFLALLLIVFHDLFNLYRKIGIEKLLGYGLFTIWTKYSLPIVLMELVAMTSTTIILIPMNFKVCNTLFWQFTKELSAIYLITVIFTIMIISIPYAYVDNISLSDIIKNKRPVKATITLNNVIKVILLSITVVLSVKSVTNVILMTSTYNSSYSKWEKTKDYVVIPEIAHTDYSYDPTAYSEAIKEKELYLYFNKKGSILANFDLYIPYMRKDNAKHLKEDYMLNHVIVNPNYLKENIVYDINNNIVNISEDFINQLLLIPDKYMPYENEIREFYNYMENKHSDDCYKECPHKKIEGSKNYDDILAAEYNKLEIIWIKSNQKLFSYQLGVNPTEGNYVTDPIIEILTESNGTLYEYFTVLGDNSIPFKIKVDEPEYAREEVNLKLSEYYDLSIFMFPIEVVYDNVETQISNLKEELKLSILFIAVLIIMVSIIIFQNISMYFNQYKERLTIQKLQGYRLIDKYDSYFLSNVLCWICVLAITLLATKSIVSIWIVLIIFTLEIITTIVMIFSLEKKNIVRFTKGG